MFELFLIGTFWFWVLLLTEIILLFVFVEYENGFGATISLLVFGGLLQWCGDTDIVGFVGSSPTKVLAILAAYLILGAVWGTIKWWLWCYDRLEKYQELKDEFLKEKGLPSGSKVPDEYKKAWKTRLESKREYGTNSHWHETPRVRENKARIVRWMSFWVVSMIWTFLDDFVKRTFQIIYRRIASFLQRIADNMFAGIREDIED